MIDYLAVWLELFQLLDSIFLQKEYPTSIPRSFRAFGCKKRTKNDN